MRARWSRAETYRCASASSVVPQTVPTRLSAAAKSAARARRRDAAPCRLLERVAGLHLGQRPRSKNAPRRSVPHSRAARRGRRPRTAAACGMQQRLDARARLRSRGPASAAVVLKERRLCVVDDGDRLLPQELDDCCARASWSTPSLMTSESAACDSTRRVAALARCAGSANRRGRRGKSPSRSSGQLDLVESGK